MIEVKGLKKTFDTLNGPLEVLKGIDAEIKDGEKVAIIGGDEYDIQTVMMKNMQTGESEQIPFVNL